MRLTYSILIALTLLAVAVILARNAHGCAEGTIEYRGDCYRNFRPTEDSNTDYPVRRQWESDDKPPKDKMPSYEREGIHADNPPSLSVQDAKQDTERNEADAEGKKAAGIK